MASPIRDLFLSSISPPGCISPSSLAYTRPGNGSPDEPQVVVMSLQLSCRDKADDWRGVVGTGVSEVDITSTGLWLVG